MEKGTLTHLRLALTGTNSCPLLLDGTDAVIGKPIDDDTIEGKILYKKYPSADALSEMIMERKGVNLIAQLPN